MRLETDKGRFATKNNEMIFSSPVYLVSKEDVHLYHIIDENGDTIYIPKEEEIIYF